MFYYTHICVVESRCVLSLFTICSNVVLLCSVIWKGWTDHQCVESVVFLTIVSLQLKLLKVSKDCVISCLSLVRDVYRGVGTGLVDPAVAGPIFK